MPLRSFLVLALASAMFGCGEGGSFFGEKATPTPAPTPGPTVAPTPKPGAWMWDPKHKNPLSATPKH
jgi:hypothetical protein